MATISGTWIFNTTISKIPCSESVIFWSKGEMWIGMEYEVYSEVAWGETVTYTYLSYRKEIASDGGRYLQYAYYHKLSKFGEGYRHIDFGETPQPVSETFYNWFIKNATPWKCAIVTDETNTFKLAVEQGETLALKCSGKVFPADVTVRNCTEQPTNVYYNGSLMNTLAGGKKMVLKCGGLKARSNIHIGETPYILSGTWLYNTTDHLRTNNGISDEFRVECNFSSGGRTFSSMSLIYDGSTLDHVFFKLFYDDLFVARFADAADSVSPYVDWENEAYRTITFDGIEVVPRWFYNEFNRCCTKQNS